MILESRGPAVAEPRTQPANRLGGYMHRVQRMQVASASPSPHVASQEPASAACMPKIGLSALCLSDLPFGHVDGRHLTSTAGRSAHAEYRRRQTATTGAATAPLALLVAAVAFIGVRLSAVFAQLLALAFAVAPTPALLLGNAWLHGSKR